MKKNLISLICLSLLGCYHFPVRTDIKVSYPRFSLKLCGPTKQARPDVPRPTKSTGKLSPLFGSDVLLTKCPPFEAFGKLRSASPCTFGTAQRLPQTPRGDSV